VSGIDWQARARREAAVIVTNAVPLVHASAPAQYDRLVSLVAIGWLQGVNYGSHETLAAAEEAFDRARAEL